MDYKKFRFPGQRSDEEVVFVLRRNWITDFLALLRLLIVGVIPSLIVLYLSYIIFDSFSQILLSIMGFYLVFMIQYSYISWTNDELDLMLVTTERVIDFTEVSFLSHDAAEAPLSQVQDVKGSVKGLLGSVFHFGTVRIFTANHTAVFELGNVSNPLWSARKILDFVEKRKDQTKEEDLSQVSEKISEKNETAKQDDNSKKTQTAKQDDFLGKDKDDLSDFKNDVRNKIEDVI